MPSLEDFSWGEFLKLQTRLSGRARQGVERVEDVFDTIGSGKFKVPFLLGRLGRNVKRQLGTGAL